MIDQQFAAQFAEEWIASWNSHDLDRILAHYSDDFAFSGPFVSRVTGVATGVLHGKDAMRQYWTRALELVPDLRFELVDVLLGIGSIVLYYRNRQGLLNAETFEFGPDRLALRSAAHGALRAAAV